MNDVIIAQKYLNKYHNAKNTGIHFNLSLTSFKNLMRAKRCYYTGIIMTTKRTGKLIRATDRTVDRLDSSKGYVKGNVVACCHTANKMKGTIECPKFLIGTKGIINIVKAIEKSRKVR